MTGKPLGPGLLAAYGAPAAAFAIRLLPPYVFLPGFYTQTLGLPLDWIGYIIILSRVFDAFTDPLIGYMSDLIYVCAPAPLQAGAARGLAEFGPGYYAALCREFVDKREWI